MTARGLRRRRHLRPGSAVAGGHGLRRPPPRQRSSAAGAAPRWNLAALWAAHARGAESCSAALHRWDAGGRHQAILRVAVKCTTNNAVADAVSTALHQLDNLPRLCLSEAQRCDAGMRLRSADAGAR